MAEIGGIDFAWTKPDPAATKNCGYSFVLGYLSQSPGKNLSGGQIAAYLNAGLRVGLVWETTTNRVLSGSAGGAADGAAAEVQANAAGYPATAPIFFAVDFDAQPGDYGTIQAYADAFNAATRRPVGIYGGANVVDHFVTPGQQPVQYGWQTAAWSGGRVSSKAHLYQRIGHVNWPLIPGVPGDAFDEDVLLADLPLAGSAASPPPPITSYNGWLASANPADFGGLDNRVVPGTPGVQLTPGVRAGDVADIFFYLASRFHAEVEPLVQAQGCWGFSFRPDTNDPALTSCHGSATAGDLNAVLHPNGRQGTFTAEKVAAVNAILADLDGVVYWGENGWGNPAGNCDGMHFEIAQGKTAADVAAVAAKIRGDNPPPPPPAPVLVIPPVPAAPPWPSRVPRTEWFGLRADPNPKSHGGYYAWEQPYVRWIQQKLISLGCVPDVTDWRSGWADGKFDQATFNAVACWQGAHRPGTQFWGAVWHDDYLALAQS